MSLKPSLDGDRPADARAAGTAGSSDVAEVSFPIVAVGASAGGLAAITQLLRLLGGAPGFAIVFIQHLDPSHSSNLVDLLRKVTPMPVGAVIDGTIAEVNRVYVIPPGTEMTIERERLRLVPRTLGPAPHLAVDAFFDSLAAARGADAVGVVLSGTASDGARGIRAIKGEGGVTFAQEGAEHPGMPLSAIATGCVDFALPIEGIAAELLRLGAAPREEAASSPSEKDAFNRILSALRHNAGVDFAHYKPTTLRRRMQRRAAQRRVANLDEYAAIVAVEPDEAAALAEEVLIHVTSFFRDPVVFDALKKEVFPRILSDRRTGEVRVWVPGCSTGEEVYSVAICFYELMAERGGPEVPLKIFGTDVSRRALDQARVGVYPESIADDVGQERLARFFVKTERGYEIAKDVRDRCVFASHDIARDPPFSRMDVISCRNLMIYLDPALQRRVLPMFHYAIREQGFLVLGTAETVGTFAGFQALDSKNRIYVRAPGPARLPFDFGDVRGWSAPSQTAGRSVDRATSAGDVRRDADRAILAAITRAGVVVTDELAIVEFRGEMAPYLEPIPGAATLDLLRMAREELRLPLRRTLDEARVGGKTARYPGVTIASGDARVSVDIDVVPFFVAPAGARFFAVLFTECATLVPPEPALTDPGQAAAADALRQELGSTRDYLQSVIEQLEAGNEELKAANEEIVSSNEELQSTNEELQSAKEELQATNEELRTVNDEMLERNLETKRLADDLSNVLSSVAIPILILGRDSRIRRFTPAARKLLELTPADVNRPLTEVATKVKIADLSVLLADVLERLAPLERVIQTEDGRWYQLHVRPYMTLDNRVDGTVLSIYDVDALKKAELLLAEARDYAESIVDTMREYLLVLDVDLRVRTVNRAFCQEFKTTPQEVVGRRLDALGGKPWTAPELARMLEKLGRGETVGELHLERVLPDAEPRSLVVTGRRISPTGWILLTIADITDRVQMDLARTEARLAQSEAGFRRMLTSAAEAIVMSDEGRKLVFANDTAARIFGYGEGELLGISIDALLPDRADGGDLIGRRKDATEFPVEVAMSAMEGTQGPLLAAFVSDVTLRRESERKIREYQAKLQRMAFEAALAEERERRRIAQDLHDRVGQSLALARMKLEAVRGGAVEEVHAAIATTIELIAMSIEDTRTLTFDLAPPVLYDLGLKAALSWLCEDIEKRSGVHVDLVDDGNHPRFEEATAALLFRAVRELLTNVFKHAQASTARVVLKQADKNHFEIDVEDAGAGFDVENIAHGPNAGFGLFSVRERIARLGGTVAIESMPQRGTRVSLRVPVATDRSANDVTLGGREP
jgi:two-component system CheB/CheR fusion protein